MTIDRELTMSRAIVEAIESEMRADDEVFYMGEDVADYGGIFDSTQGLLEEFSHDRIMDVPISETAYLGAAVGAAAHVGVFRHLVVDLIHRDAEEVDEHEFRDGAHPLLGGADGRAEIGRLADRHVHDPVVAELL